MKMIMLTLDVNDGDYINTYTPYSPEVLQRLLSLKSGFTREDVKELDEDMFYGFSDLEPHTIEKIAVIDILEEHNLIGIKFGDNFYN